MDNTIQMNLFEYFIDEEKIFYTRCYKSCEEY